MELPQHLKYTKEHEWARLEGNRVVVGITDFAQEELGDVVFVELPQQGAAIEAMGIFGVVESVKAVSDLYSPVSGTIVETNTRLEEQPELVNTSPYDEGWMIVIELTTLDVWEELLSADAYAAYITQGQSS